ncbi:PREDICTED: transmembrane protein 144-like isoform X2 [Priapulus caudatus]|uniref:Transmembrane protein 144-like isoform X2 n=1 Tax=Priapulus caudatus TaxID=37621 RepID=A0ABM1E9F5_PRICU|nr:PREDICTED: transmembrane protein 144-like isoform X2 [Priapulus caudatus]
MRRFGMFGIKKEIPDNLALNYTGVTFALVGAILFIFIKSEGGGPMRVATRLDSATEPLIVNPVGDLPHDLARDRPLATTCVEPADPDETSIDRLQPSTKRVVGVSLSVISGLFYGVTFVPVIYIQDNYKDSSQNGLDYVFAHMNGVLLTSCVTFIAYCAVMRNRPRVYPRAILPGLVSGAMLACGVTGWFIANQVLTETISFPIITTGPGVIAALWGVFVFREIQGKRNYLILLLAMCFILTGALLCAFSL